MKEISHLHENHIIIQEFLDFGYKEKDYISNFIKATMAQFLINTRSELFDKADAGEVRRADIIGAQINQLSKCLLDLRECQEYVTHRDNLQ